jgi:mono/diheme cytochrome c family protein
VGAWLGLIVAGCGGPDARHLRYGGPIGSSDVARGRSRYEVVCVPCHGDHELRRGPLLVNQRWTPARIRQRVREGTSSMPAIPLRRLGTDDLESLLAYFLTTGVCADEEEAREDALW